MTAKQLMEILSMANEDDLILVTSTYYDGNEECTTIEIAEAFLHEEGLLISDVKTMKYWKDKESYTTEFNV